MDRLTLLLAVGVFGGVFGAAMLLVPGARTEPQTTAPSQLSGGGTSSEVDPEFRRVMAKAEALEAEATAEGQPPRDAFRPGEWETTSHVTAGGYGDRKQDMTFRKCIRADNNPPPTKASILEMISRQNCNADHATIGGGSISGTLTCPGMDDIREHPEYLSGYYNHDAVHAVISLTAFGTGFRQTLDFRRIGDCPVVRPGQGNKRR
jgi:hypothetical protein